MQWPIRNKLSLRCKLLINIIIKGLHNLGVYSKQKNKEIKDPWNIILRPYLLLFLISHSQKTFWKGTNFKFEK